VDYSILEFNEIRNL